MANVIRHCACCGREFTAKSADVKRGWGLYCGKRCKAIKQESNTGQYQSLSTGRHDDPQADQSWGEHEIWSDRT